MWSAGYQPCAGQPNSYEVSFTEDRVEIIRTDGDLTTTLEVQVSPEDDAEVRRVSVSNASTRAREIEITSYAEIVLGSASPRTSRIPPSRRCSCAPNSSQASPR